MCQSLWTATFRRWLWQSEAFTYRMSFTVWTFKLKPWKQLMREVIWMFCFASDLHQRNIVVWKQKVGNNSDVYFTIQDINRAYSFMNCYKSERFVKVSEGHFIMNGNWKFKLFLHQWPWLSVKETYNGSVGYSGIRHCCALALISIYSTKAILVTLLIKYKME